MPTSTAFQLSFMKSLPVKGFGEFTTIFEKQKSLFSYPHLMHNFHYGMKSSIFPIYH
jgi:hypothetical protein